MASGASPANPSRTEPLAEPAPLAAASEALPSMDTASAEGDLLTVKNLRTFFFTYDGIVRAIDGTSFRLKRGETVGLVGETGSGKSVTAFSITRLIPDPPGRIIEGEVKFRGANLLWRLEREAKFKENPKTHRMKVRRRFREIRDSNLRMS
ncbi:MAG: ATP-binding cassette domain-containing protein, partial [Thermoplasmata archaeon]